MSSVNAIPVQGSESSSGDQWRFGTKSWAGLILAISLIALIFSDGIAELLHLWEVKEEYSHGYLIPLISLFLAWQKYPELRRETWGGSWCGVAIVLAGLVFYLVGALSTIYFVMHYALIVTLAGVVLSFTGRGSWRYLWVPVLFLCFMIPLPQFLYQAISTKLQLISSELGVWVIRLFDISVYLEGNVIDLGSYKLQVVEACDGLRYIFPLASFGFLCAYLYRGPLWHKGVVFVSTIPITVFMNSFRIGVIGVTVEYWGQEAAEGFLHDFEGWAIFMACLAVLFCEMWVLARLRRPPMAFSDVFYVDMPQRSLPAEGLRGRLVPPAFVGTLVLLFAGFLSSAFLPTRQEIIPERENFTAFPLQLGDWSGTTEALEKVYLDALKLSDYLLVNYVQDASGEVVNLYMAYYDSQRAGESAHSPRSCIPGGGWKITDLSTIDLDTDAPQDGIRKVNRVQIAMGDSRQLVYYWFQQRGRVIANEYLVKWFLFWDALTKNRSDGALVRFVTAVKMNESWGDGDERLRAFSRSVGGRLSDFVPE